MISLFMKLKKANLYFVKSLHLEHQAKILGVVPTFQKEVVEVLAQNQLHIKLLQHAIGKPEVGSCEVQYEQPHSQARLSPLRRAWERGYLIPRSSTWLFIIDSARKKKAG